jgi:predicted amidohydrolase
MFSNHKIAIVQDSPGAGINDYYFRILKESTPDIIAFPEYYFVQPEDKSLIDSSQRKDKILRQLIDWSKEFDCIIIGGSLVEKESGYYYNRSYLLDKDDIVGYYDKIHLFCNEGKGKLSPGLEYKIFTIGDLRIGIIICADVLYPDTFRNLRGLKPDLVFVPTTSPFRSGETHSAKFARDNEIFAIGATLANAVIFKVSACGSIAGHRLQGRSLMASPGKILWRVEPEDEDKSALIISNLSGDIANPLLDIKVHRQ